MKRKKNVILYALSTCVWCKKTKRLLNQLGVDYDFIDVDLLSPDEKEEVMDVVEQYNPDGSLPLIVIDDEESISGYDEERIREALS